MPELITAKRLAEAKKRVDAVGSTYETPAIIATLERAVDLLDRTLAVGTLNQALGSRSEPNDSPWADISVFLKEFDRE